MTSAIIIPNVTMEDKGTYRCRATVGTSVMDATVKVAVYGEYDALFLFVITF